MRTSFLAASLALAALLPASHVAAQSAQDKAIAQQIGSQLKQSGQLHDYRIGVKYKDGVAALSGTVANQQQLHAALQLTQQMNGVDQVVNNLSIAKETKQNFGKPATLNRASQANFAANGPQSGMATRTSYQQSGPQQPMMRPGMNGPGMNGPGMSQNPNMGPMGPMGPRPQRPMNAGRMPMPQGRGGAPMPMGGRPPIQQAMAQQANMQQAMMAQRPPMQAMQAGCNCGPGGPGGGGMMGGGYGGDPSAMGYMGGSGVNYDNAQMPGYAWPSYASYPNYAALSYPTQYSPTAWPYIGPFYPYPQVPLGWRKVCLEWDDGWWFLDFSDCGSNH
ncbi:MAG: BON domain-containing protein [Pirellulales bacterium]